MPLRKRDILTGVVLLALSLGAGAVGSIATSMSVNDWYLQLARPEWNPPSWVFAPVWTFLYIAMAVAAWLYVVRAGSLSAASRGLTLFGVQLALNAAWSWLFFGFRAPGAALVEIVFLWVAILATTREFLAMRRSAGWLMVPYLLWVSFAALLNAAIWRLNL